MPHTTTLTPIEWVLIACLCIPQGILLFRSAQKRGHFPWLWGLWGLVSFPLPSVCYFIFVILRDRRKAGTHTKQNGKG